MSVAVLLMAELDAMVKSEGDARFLYRAMVVRAVREDRLIPMMQELIRSTEWITLSESAGARVLLFRAVRQQCRQCRVCCTSMPR
jgi:hypothetical protein